MKIVYDRGRQPLSEQMEENMKKKIEIKVLLLLALGSCIFLHAATSEAKNFNLSADSAIVMDVQSGTILYQKNMDKKQYPASITKIMTSLLAIENSSMSETVTYSKGAVTNLESGASNIGLVPGEKLSMEESLYAILLMSANEACNGVAEHIAGSIDDYVAMMNKRAKELGCTGTHFANTNGLWMKNHYTTAHDMALISREAYKNPDFAKITGTKRYNIKKTNKAKNGHSLVNHHGMLVAGKYPQYVYEYCVGGKTGFTLKCRYTLVTYAKKNDMTLVSVVMRAEAPWNDLNEYSDTTKLLNYCFENYTRYGIENTEIENVNDQYLFTRFSPLYNKNTTSLTVDPDAGVILPKNVKFDQAEKKVEYYKDALVDKEGRKIIGKISYTYKGKEVGGSNIYYTNLSYPTLNDSIDMSEWFDDAVEKVNKKPFPWKKVILITILILVVLFVIFYVVQRILAEREIRYRRKRYKKTNRRQRKTEREMYYRRK